jgi:hypothetical protein
MTSKPGHVTVFWTKTVLYAITYFVEHHAPKYPIMQCLCITPLSMKGNTHSWPSIPAHPIKNVKFSAVDSSFLSCFNYHLSFLRDSFNHSSIYPYFISSPFALFVAPFSASSWSLDYNSRTEPHLCSDI